jgi:hypothetical protein
VSTEPPTVDALDANLRRVAARVSQLEDAIEIYGPPAKRWRLPIPEVTPTQREFLLFLAFFSLVSLVTASQKRRRGSD